ncbi:MAG TPA: ABC transporter permease [Polyangiaceae bacterium]|nr:ABC transporter permease [Polyangiaceae bacterium]
MSARLVRGARRPWHAVLGALGGALILFLVLPVVGLLSGTTLADVRAGLEHPLVAPALELSFFTTTVSAAVVILFGTPLAWIIAERRGGGARLLESALKLPVVLPPAVAGLGLLLAFGRTSVLGALFARLGVGVPFTSAAVVLAQVFVSAPFYVEAAIAAFRRLDADLLVIARSLGAGTARVLFRVALPLAAPGLLSGVALAWARALGEFGATLMFAGSLSGRTQTLPLAIYAALESDVRAARALSLVLVCIAFVLLFAVRSSERVHGPGPGARP